MKFRKHQHVEWQPPGGPTYGGVIQRVHQDGTITVRFDMAFARDPGWPSTPVNTTRRLQATAIKRVFTADDTDRVATNLQAILDQRAAVRPPVLTIHIHGDDGKHLLTFFVPVEGGWPLHKVAEEIRSNVENAYRVKEPQS